MFKCGARLSEDLSDLSPWPTVRTTRDVLVVVHNVTAVTRLLDVVELVGSDLRVQTKFSVPPFSAFVDGTERFLVDRGWEAGTRRYPVLDTVLYGGRPYPPQRLEFLGTSSLAFPPTDCGHTQNTSWDEHTRTIP